MLAVRLGEQGRERAAAAVENEGRRERGAYSQLASLAEPDGWRVAG